MKFKISDWLFSLIVILMVVTGMPVEVNSHFNSYKDHKPEEIIYFEYSGVTPIAEGKAKFLGNVYSQSQAVGFTDYWNQVTPENAGKWGSVESTRDVMNWSELDKAYALAKDNDFPFKLHVLIWGNQQPSWIESLLPSEQLEEIEEWFEELSNRYPDMDFIEVVNEPLHDPPNSSGNGGGNYINALGGTGTTGWDWVLEAFRMARQYFPDARLKINEYNIVNDHNNTTSYLNLIRLLMDENLIDLIGVQAHAFSTRGSVNVMQNNLDRLAETGLPLYVTELDIDGPTDQVQLEDYQRIFPLFWEHEAVMGITLWGFRPGMWRTQQMAYLIENDGSTERPALQWLRSYVENSTVNTVEVSPSGHIRISPNPLRGSSLTIEGGDLIERVELYGIGGEKISTLIPVNQIIRFHVLPDSGTYLLKIYSERSVYIKKLMINRD